MRYWWGELTGLASAAVGLLGLALVALSLYIFYEVFIFFSDAHYVQAVAWLIVAAFFLFRGGIQLIKVALAARICSDIPSQQVEVRRPRTDGRYLSPGKTAPMGQT
jgi:hypothetical protein